MKNKLIGKFYATILDSFYDYIHSDVIYQKYWGFSEDPPHTEEEFAQIQFEELINRINRVPFDSEAASRGTAFNELVDALIENRKPKDVEVVRTPDNMYYQAIYKECTFTFPIPLCREFANYFKGALTQVRTEAILPTCYGDVLVYGFIDELLPTSVHDIKTTSRYSTFKFKDHFQHLVYPYALMQNGNDVRTFEYNITDFKETYTESYTFVPERDIPKLTSHCEEFIIFLNENKELITDKKIFAIDDL